MVKKSSQGVDGIDERFHEGFHLRGAIRGGAVLFDEFDDGAADHDAIRLAGDFGGLGRIGDAETDADRHLVWPFG
jgi:hypothetical protein